MTDVVVGMDVGGTKAAVIVETVGGELLVDHVFSSTDWEASPTEEAVDWLLAIVSKAVVPTDRIAALGIGAQGCDTAERCDELEAALAARGYRAVVVNDAALVAPAAGVGDAIGIIAGTGAIGVARSAAGEQLIAGGWGWVISDDAGAAGIVRVATVAALTAHEEQQPDDGLLGALEEAFDVESAEALARAVNDDASPSNWAPRAPAVFAAADAGSALAAAVVRAAGEYLATVVGWLVRRGAAGSTVVVAGSVIVNQPRLVGAFRDALNTRRTVAGLAPLTVTVLEGQPVAGAVVLARGILGTHP